MDVALGLGKARMMFTLLTVEINERKWYNEDSVWWTSEKSRYLFYVIMQTFDVKGYINIKLLFWPETQENNYYNIFVTR